MQRRYSVAIVSTVVVISWGYWVNQQPSIDCKVNKDVARYALIDADTLKRLSENVYGSGIYGDFYQEEIKYKKADTDLFLISEAYRLKASNLIIENQKCFTELEISEANKVIKFQKYLENLK